MHLCFSGYVMDWCHHTKHSALLAAPATLGHFIAHTLCGAAIQALDFNFKVAQWFRTGVCLIVSGCSEELIRVCIQGLTHAH